VTAGALAAVLLLIGCGPFGDEPQPGLWVVDVDGTGERLLVEPAPVEPSDPIWSPDGRSIAYVGAKPGVADADLENEVLVIPIDSGDPVNLTTAIAGECVGFEWAPDGSRLAVLCFGTGAKQDIQLWSIPADGTTAALLAETDPVDFPSHPDVEWAPSGERIAFVAGGPLGLDLFVIDSDGSDLRNLTADAAVDRSPTWAPDGSAIAFVTGDWFGGDIVVIGPDGTGRRTLTGDGWYGGVAWQPEGDTLLVTGLPSTGSTGEGIWTVRADGTGLTLLIEDGYVPAWSPGGDRIAFVADGVRIARADGSDVRRLASGERILQIAWSPDGTRLAFDLHGPWD
jgi:TolB protein